MRILLQKAGLKISNINCSRFLPDPLQAMPVSPLHPEIVARFDKNSYHTFKRHDPHVTIDLTAFVEESYSMHAYFERDSFQPFHFNMADFSKRLEFSGSSKNSSKSKMKVANPKNSYAHLPGNQF